MYGKSIGDREAFQKAKNNWQYHQRQKHWYIQVALILQEPIDISPGIELLTTPSAGKAECALTGGEWGSIFHFYFLKWQYPLQRMGLSPLPLGLWDLFLQPHHHQSSGFCGSAAVLAQLCLGTRAHWGLEKRDLLNPQTKVWSAFSQTWKKMVHQRSWKNSYIALCPYSHLFS